MKSRLTHHLMAALLGVVFTAELRAQTRAFTYQGHLTESGRPANGNYDFELALYDVLNGGSSVVPPMTNQTAVVSNGLFTIILDFGSGAFDGSDRWLEVSVRTNGGGAFNTLSPRQQVTSAPYAIKAAGVDAVGLMGTISSSQIADGTITAADLAAGSVGAAEIADGSVTAVDINGGSFNTTFWRVNGNAGTTADFLGTTDNQPLELWVNFQRALRLEYPSVGYVPNLIGGYGGNTVGAGTHGAVIAGGGSTVLLNTIGADADYSSIGGGDNNNIADASGYSTIAGGSANDIAGAFSAIGGGYNNKVAYSIGYATIAGGQDNDIGEDSHWSVIGGGWDVNIASNSFGATISGGGKNTVADNSPYSTVGGGLENLLGNDSSYGAISGGQLNTILSGSTHAAIGGGAGNIVFANSHYSAIGGGGQNTIQINAPLSTISGGQRNTIQSNAVASTIGGGTNNLIGADSFSSTIAGGEENTIEANCIRSAVGGGWGNRIGWGSWQSTIAGGFGNQVIDSDVSVVAGGILNIITNAADSAIGGGTQNLIETGASYATIPGGYHNGVGPNADYALAAGNRAKANHQGTFVWADSQSSDFASQRVNQFRVRADGGARFDVNNGHYVDITRVALPNRVISTSTGAYLSEGGVWTDSSDRAKKDGFQAIDPEAILEQVNQLPITTWNFKTEESSVRHIGPVAQDFHAAFGVGADDKHIAALDANGVALAAIQGLSEKVDERIQNGEQAIRELRAENAELKQTLNELKELMQTVNLKLNGGVR